MSTANDAAPRPIVVLGAATCEDTAIVVDRLRAIGTEYRYADIDDDPAALAHIRRLNGGERITPTVIVGADEIVVAEPSLERLGELLEAAGHGGERPIARQLHGAITDRAIPTRSVVTPAGVHFSLGALRGKRQVALLLGHGGDCLACLGYARQLSRQALDQAGATSVIVVNGGESDAAAWADALAPGAVLVSDPAGAWKATVASHLDLSSDEALLILLDRWLAPRVVSHSPQAGGLVDPSEATDWLRFIELECPECSGEIEWPEESLTI